MKVSMQTEAAARGLRLTAWALMAGMMAGVLAGCGGGGGGAAETPVPPPPPALEQPLPGAVRLQIPDQLTTETPVSLVTDQGYGDSSWTFQWELGDGATSSLPNPVFAWGSEGDYTVRVTVGDGKGQRVSASGVVKVRRAAPLPDPKCASGAKGLWCTVPVQAAAQVLVAHEFLDSQRGFGIFQSGSTAAAGDTGRELKRTTDAGRTWTTVLADSEARWGRFFRSTDRVLYVLGPSGGTQSLRSVDGGTSWEGFSLPGSGVLVGATPVGNSTLVVVLNVPAPGTRLGFVPGYFRSMDGGRSWASGSAPLQAVRTESKTWLCDQNVLRVQADDAVASDVVSGAPRCADFSLTSDDGRRMVVYRTPEGGLRVSEDEGQTWSTRTLGKVAGRDELTMGSFALYPANAGWARWYDNRPDGQIALLGRTVDGGASWQLLDRIDATWLDARTVVAEATTTSARQISTDAGATWHRLPIPQWLATGVDGAPARHSSGALINGPYRSTDDGLTWLTLPVANTWPRPTVTWFFDAQRGLGMRTAGELYSTNDGGISWNRREIEYVFAAAGAAPVTTDLHFDAQGVGWMLMRGDILRSDNGGATWSALVLPTGMKSAVYRISTPGQKEIWASVLLCLNVSECSSSVLRSADLGATWTALPAAGSDVLQMAAPAPGVAVIARRDGHVLRTTNGGVTWADSVVPTSDVGLTEITNVKFADAQVGWMENPLGYLYLTSDGGSTWRALHTPLDRPIEATDRQGRLDRATFVSPDRGWIVGLNSGQGIYSTVDGGRTWIRDPLPDGWQNLSGSVDLTFLNAVRGWLTLNYFSGSTSLRWLGLP